jgi:hypothetical protein
MGIVDFFKNLFTKKCSFCGCTDNLQTEVVDDMIYFVCKKPACKRQLNIIKVMS